jgi:hypothetical protein
MRVTKDTLSGNFVIFSRLGGYEQSSCFFRGVTTHSLTNFTHSFDTYITSASDISILISIIQRTDHSTQNHRARSKVFKQNLTSPRYSFHHSHHIHLSEPDHQLVRQADHFYSFIKDSHDSRSDVDTPVQVPTFRDSW